MGCQCSYHREQDEQTIVYSSNMKFSIDQEIPINGPRKSMLMPKSFSIDIVSGGDVQYAANTQKSSQNLTLQNILNAFNGMPDSIKEEKYGKKQRKKKSRSKRISMEDLEKLF